MRMPTVLRDILTSADNETYDWLPVLAAVGTLAFVAYSGWALAAGQAWEPVSYGTGLAAVLAAAGGAQRMRDGPAPPEPLPPARDK